MVPATNGLFTRTVAVTSAVSPGQIESTSHHRVLPFWSVVPVAGGILIADIASQIDLPLMIIARPGLGTINHTFLTTFAAQQMNLPLAGYLINRMPELPDSACQTAPHTMASLISTDLLGVLPEITDDNLKNIIELLASELEALPTLPLLLTALGIES